MKNKTTKLLANKTMNSDVYKLRTQVIELIYEIKKIQDLPRIDVRITDDAELTLGVAQLSSNIIWISERAIKDNRFDLRTVVYHEVLHAVYGILHDESCPLMKSKHTPLTKELCQSLFMKYARKQA